MLWASGPFLFFFGRVQAREPHRGDPPMRLPHLPLLLAAAAFLLALFAGARQWQAHFRTVPILRVQAPVAAGQPVPAAAVAVVQVPAGGRPPGALTGTGALAGRWARVPLLPGETLLEAHLTAEPPPLALADRLPPGRLLLSVPVRPEAALQGALQPGDRVDAWAIFPARDGQPGRVQPLARGLPVLDVRNAEGAPTGAAARGEAPGRGLPAAVLLAAAPEEATAVLGALANGGDLFLLLSGRQAPEVVP